MPSQIPKDWLSEAEIIRTTGVGPRNLEQWRAAGIVVGRRRSLGRGIGTTPCFYPPDTPALIHRLDELRVVRDEASWVWQLWREGFSTDIRKWAVKRLCRDLKLVERVGPDGVAKAALRAARAKPPGAFQAAQAVFDRVRRPADRVALLSWVAAALAGYKQQASIHTREPPIWNIMLRAMGIPRSIFPPPNADLDRMSAHVLHQILASADEHELDQARRDWQAIARLTEAFANADWNVAGGEFDSKVEAITKSRPEPPSKRLRKARRQRAYAKPAIADLFLDGLLDLDIRPYLLASLIGMRRASRELSNACTQVIAFAESVISYLPQRTQDITPQGPSR
jgi:hypothetical protein